MDRGREIETPRGRSARPRSLGLLVLLLAACGLACNGDEEPTISVPEALRPCFEADVTVQVSGTYTVAGIPVPVDREGRIGDAGLTFEVASTGSDPIAEHSVPWEDFNGTLARPTETEDDCWDFAYASEPFRLAGAANCQFTASARICPGPPCTAADGRWRVRCEGAPPLGEGGWSFKE